MESPLSVQTPLLLGLGGMAREHLGSRCVGSQGGKYSPGLAQVSIIHCFFLCSERVLSLNTKKTIEDT